MVLLYYSCEIYMMIGLNYDEWMDFIIMGRMRSVRKCSFLFVDYKSNLIYIMWEGLK